MAGEAGIVLPDGWTSDMEREQLPYIPSEMIEPYLEKFCGTIIREIGMCPKFPSMKKWRDWDQKMSGVDYLLHHLNCTGNEQLRPVHAKLAFSNVRYKIVPWFSRGLDKKDARRSWRIAREGLCGKTS